MSDFHDASDAGQPAPPLEHTPPPMLEPQPPHRNPGPAWVLGSIGVVLLLAAIGWFVVRPRLLAGAQAAGPAGSSSSQAGGPGGPGGAPGDRVVPVTTAAVEKKDVPIWLEGLGNVMPIYTVTVKTQVDGRLEMVAFTEGQKVKKGELLAQIDPRPFLIQLHTAEAALARDNATLRNARLNLDRYTQLAKSNLIAQQQVTDQQTLVDQTVAAVMADQAQVDAARLNLDYAHIVSPIDGVAGVRQVDPGNLVHAADATGIVLLTQLDPIAVLFTLPEDDLPRVARELAGGALPVDAYSRDGAQKLGSGKLTVIDNQINAQTATMRLKAQFDNPDHALWPNAFVKARLLLTTKKDAVAMPAVAVQRGPDGTFVYVVDPATSTVAMHPVEVDAYAGEMAIVAKGVQPGDVVVTDGQNQLRPGSKVQARAPSTGASASASSSATAAPGGGKRGLP
jgi:multidrug efflux system membrane fusion protein